MTTQSSKKKSGLSGRFVVKMEEAGIDDVALVGGKNASLGEMLHELGSKGIRVPSGFIVTAEAYKVFIKDAGLDRLIRATAHGFKKGNLKDLAQRGKKIRSAMLRASLPEELERQIAHAYSLMQEKYGKNIDVAVRSSATAEDLPDASFAGQQETFLGIRGVSNVKKAVLATFASLYNDRAINYRAEKGYARAEIALSVAIQRMVRTDLGASGVMFTIDTETGFPDVVLINGSYGLGEMVVQGK